MDVKTPETQGGQLSYRVYHGLHEEAKEGWVWICPAATGGRPAGQVRIRNPLNGKTIVCEQRVIDMSFRRYYNGRESTLKLSEEGNLAVISGYYRDRLGLQLGSDIPLEVRPSWGPLSGVLAGLHHPSSAIRTATWLGILSFGLGALSVILSVVFVRL